MASSYLPSFMFWSDDVATKEENDATYSTSTQDSREGSNSSDKSDQSVEEEVETSYFNFGWLGATAAPTPVEQPRKKKPTESTRKQKQKPKPNPKQKQKQQQKPVPESIQHIDSGIPNEKFFTDVTRLDRETTQAPSSPVRASSPVRVVSHEEEVEVEVGEAMLSTKKPEAIEGVSFSEEATDHLRKELELYMKKQKKKNKDGKKSKKQQRKSLKKYLKKSLKKYLAQKEEKGQGEEELAERDAVVGAVGKLMNDAANPSSDDSVSSMEESVEVRIRAPEDYPEFKIVGVTEREKPMEKSSKMNSKRGQGKKDAKLVETPATLSRHAEPASRKPNDRPPKSVHVEHRPKPGANSEGLKEAPVAPLKKGTAAQKKPSSKRDLIARKLSGRDGKKRRSWHIGRSVPSKVSARSPTVSQDRIIQMEPAHAADKKRTSNLTTGNIPTVENEVVSKVVAKRSSAKTNALTIVDKDATKDKQAKFDDLKLWQKKFSMGKSKAKQKVSAKEYHTQEDSVSSSESMTKQKWSAKKNYAQEDSVSTDDSNPQPKWNARKHYTQDDSVSSNESMTKQKWSAKKRYTQEDSSSSDESKGKQKENTTRHHTQEDSVSSQESMTKQKWTLKKYGNQEDSPSSNKPMTKQKQSKKKCYTQEDSVSSGDSKTKQQGMAKTDQTQEDSDSDTSVSSNETMNQQKWKARKYDTQKDSVSSGESKAKQKAMATRRQAPEGSVSSNQSMVEQKMSGEKHDTQGGLVSLNKLKTKQQVNTGKGNLVASKKFNAKQKASAKNYGTHPDSMSISNGSNFSNQGFFRKLVDEEKRKSVRVDQAQEGKAKKKESTLAKPSSGGFTSLEMKMQLELARLEEINNGLKEEERRRREKDEQLEKAKKDIEDQENEALELFEVTKQMMREAAEQREAQIREEYEREHAAREAAREIDRQRDSLIAALAQAAADDDKPGDQSTYGEYPHKDLFDSFSRNSILVSEPDIASKKNDEISTIISRKNDDHSTIYPETVITTVTQKQRDLQEEIEAELAKLVTLQNDFVTKVELARKGEGSKQGKSILQSDLFSKQILSSTKPLKSKRSLARDSQIQDELFRLREEQSQLFSKGRYLAKT